MPIFFYRTIIVEITVYVINLHAYKFFIYIFRMRLKNFVFETFLK